METPRDLDQRIREAVEPISDIDTLVLFGSRAGDRSRPDSDLDVALLPAGGPGRGDQDRGDPKQGARRRLQTRVAVALADLAPEGRVDVVLLDEAPVLLRQRVMEQGRVLVGGESRQWRDLRVWTMKEYGDSEYYRELYRRKQAERLQKGEPSGRSGRALESLERVGRLPG